MATSKSLNQDQSYLFGSNAHFIEEMCTRYLEDPTSVDISWQEYFQELSRSGFINSDFIKDQNLRKQSPCLVKNIAVTSGSSSNDAIKIDQLKEAYKKFSHLKVNLDPLNISKPSYYPELESGYYNFEGNSSDIMQDLNNTYAGRIGIEFMHIENLEERKWLQDRIEKEVKAMTFSKDEKIEIFTALLKAEMFEHYLHVKFPGAKRFSIEGCEAAIASIDRIVRSCACAGASEVMIGMAHRGRLATLTNILQKPYHEIMYEFNAKDKGEGPVNHAVMYDVKYHLGYESEIKFGDKKINVSLVPNPSHLEAVNTVVMGMVRAKQESINDIDQNKIITLLVHGDAAFIGQGSVMEMLAISTLPAYSVGGVLHIITNNQIGFTTNACNSRGTRYSTDIAKMIYAPIVHVNGDDSEAVVWATQLAIDYRNKFKKDFVLDVVGYRKYGHNEGDEPMFTQPKMYKIIAAKKSPATIYGAKLEDEGIDINKIKEDFKKVLDDEYKLAQNYKCLPHINTQKKSIIPTKITNSSLKTLGIKISTYPESLNINHKVAKLFETRREMMETGSEIDWGMGEALAFAHLINQGIDVRISGEDVERGTFSHRHSIVIDQVNEYRYNIFDAIAPKKYQPFNSNLSEYGVLGFEYGYSVKASNNLTIWEAQFGDFANGAQIIIDQFIASAESKWFQRSNLVMLLPHGMEGQGPEHSSARLERFLQLAAQNNIRVANCSTPASLFQLLNKQVFDSEKKPLIIMTPKSLLRNRLAVSTLEDFTKEFQPLIPDEQQKSSVSKLVFVSGKVYYDLVNKRNSLDDKGSGIAIVRLEMIYPFPYDQVKQEILKYKGAEVIWCQEEHKNMGAYSFVSPHIQEILAELKIDKTLKYVGRYSAPSPAVGYPKLHEKEQNEIINQIFG